jgi:hypothetical protein
MKQIERQDIKTMIDRLDQLELRDEFDQCCIDSAIYVLEELGNLVQDSFASYEAHLHDLRLDNESLKQEILQLEAMIDD